MQTEAQIYTNNRGATLTGVPLDGHLDGYGWHAWSGPFIAYGATERQAVDNLVAKMRARADEKIPHKRGES